MADQVPSKEERIDWARLTCRHGDSGVVVGLYAIPKGCWCFDDPVQALCLQHAIKAQSTGPIDVIASRLEDE